jgi:toxin YoeB
MRKILFDAAAFEDLNRWVEVDKKVFKRLYNLITESARDPFHGTGKPEPLKGNYRGCWSRRITEEHRLIYRVSETTIEIISCRGHYND